MRLRLCRLCRQLTVSPPSHGECAERELLFDHLSGLTDSARQVCAFCAAQVVFVGSAEAAESLRERLELTAAIRGEISALISLKLLIVQSRGGPLWMFLKK